MKFLFFDQKVPRIDAQKELETSFNLVLSSVFFFGEYLSTVYCNVFFFMINEIVFLSNWRKPVITTVFCLISLANCSFVICEVLGFLEGVLSCCTIFCSHRSRRILEWYGPWTFYAPGSNLNHLSFCLSRRERGLSLKYIKAIRFGDKCNLTII